MINIDEYKYLWDSEKDDWVLVSTSFGYGIVNKKNQSVLVVSDEALELALIERMLAEGNKKYADINEAYSDVK